MPTVPSAALVCKLPRAVRVKLLIVCALCIDLVSSDPSYHAPAHYTIFRDYMVQHEDAYGTLPMEGQDAVPFWDSLIETSYAISARHPRTRTRAPLREVEARGSLPEAATFGCCFRAVA